MGGDDLRGTDANKAYACHVYGSEAVFMSAYDDELWLTNAYPMATLEQLESFLERVAIKMADGTSEATARAEALKEMLGR